MNTRDKNMSTSYQPLTSDGSFRLLKFEQQAPHEQFKICCDLSVFPIESCPPYTCLSYTWGSPIDGVGSEKYKGAESNVEIGLSHSEGHRYGHPITRNLFELLDQIFSALKPANVPSTYFWVDALCINQDDYHERTCQVQLMGAIFANAGLAIAWLGCEDMVFDVVTDFVKKIESNRPSEPGIGLFGGVKALGDGNLLVEGTNVTTKTDNLLFYVYFLATRRYFQRGWILQEAALAKKVLFQYGSFTMSVGTMTGFAYWLKGPILKSEYRRLFGHAFQQEVEMAYQCILTILQLRNSISAERKNDAQDLMTRMFGPLTAEGRRFGHMVRLLQMKGGMTVSDPHDTFYSLIGIVDRLFVDQQDSQAIALRPEYQDPPEEVNVEFATGCLRHLPCSYLFSLLEPRKTLTSGAFPSWIPDLVTRTDLSRELGGLQGVKIPAGALMKEHSKFFDCYPNEHESSESVDIRDHEASLFGRFCDKVVAVSSLTRTYQKSSPERLAWVRGVLGFIVQCYSRDKQYLTGESTTQAFANTLHREFLEEEWLESWLTMLEYLISHVLIDLGVDPKQEADQEQEQPVAALDRQLEKLLQEVQRRRSESDGSGGDDEEACTIADSLLDLSTTYSLTEFNKSEPDLLEDLFAALVPHGNLFQTSRGYIGHGKYIQPGDEVWLLCGAKIPMTLRPAGHQDENQDDNQDRNEDGDQDKNEEKEETNEEKGKEKEKEKGVSEGERREEAPPQKYQILGETYLHGGMYGELFERGHVGELRQVVLV